MLRAAWVSFSSALRARTYEIEPITTAVALTSVIASRISRLASESGLQRRRVGRAEVGSRSTGCGSGPPLGVLASFVFLLALLKASPSALASEHIETDSAPQQSEETPSLDPSAEIPPDAGGKGYTFGDTGLWVGGYVNIVGEAPEEGPASAGFDDLGILLRYEPTA